MLQTSKLSVLYRYQPISIRQNSIVILLLSSSAVFQSAAVSDRQLNNASTATRLKRKHEPVTACCLNWR